LTAESSEAVTLLTEFWNNVKKKTSMQVGVTGLKKGGNNPTCEANFRDVQVFPTSEEILIAVGPKNLNFRKIPKNIIEGAYDNVDIYLATHFLLLREDCIAPLRDGIQAYLKGIFYYIIILKILQHNNRHHNLKIINIIYNFIHR
jgi:hypothetical protein